MGRMICKGYESRSLYYIGISSYVSCVASESSKLLHERLGHRHLTKLKMVHELSSLQTWNVNHVN